MNKLFLALLILIGLALPAAADTKCALVSEKDFIAQNSAPGTTLLVATPAALDRIKVYINKTRAEKKLFLLEADKILIGLFQRNGKAIVGLVWFSKGCVMPGTVETMPAEAFVALLVSLDLTLDDFVKDAE